MYGREQRVLLRHYLAQELSKAEIARAQGLSRRTVHHWIRTGQLERKLDTEPVRRWCANIIPARDHHRATGRVSRATCRVCESAVIAATRARNACATWPSSSSDRVAMPVPLPRMPRSLSEL